MQIIALPCNSFIMIQIAQICLRVVSMEKLSNSSISNQMSGQLISPFCLNLNSLYIRDSCVRSPASSFSFNKISLELSKYSSELLFYITFSFYQLLHSDDRKIFEVNFYAVKMLDFFTHYLMKLGWVQGCWYFSHEFLNKNVVCFLFFNRFFTNIYHFVKNIFLSFFLSKGSYPSYETILLLLSFSLLSFNRIIDHGLKNIFLLFCNCVFLMLLFNIFEQTLYHIFLLLWFSLSLFFIQANKHTSKNL